MSDLAVEAFYSLRNHFYDGAGTPKPFALREKRNTQDDPFDELLAQKVLTRIRGATCVKAPGPLVSPDLVLYRERRLPGKRATDLKDDLQTIVGIEVKKLERSGGAVARASGLDFNTTPPCGTVAAYDRAGILCLIRGFYLFVCLEEGTKNQRKVTAMVLADGNVLNADFELYRQIAVDARTKEIGLGSYGDGVNRVRPMMIFSNPLGVEKFDHQVTLIHPSENLDKHERVLRLVASLERKTVASGTATFFCYRYKNDGRVPKEPQRLVDPFPVPERDTATRGRGKFTLPFSL